MKVFYSTKILFIRNFLDLKIDGSQILPDVAKCSISGLPRWTAWRKDDDDNCSIQSIPNFCCVLWRTQRFVDMLLVLSHIPKSGENLFYELNSGAGSSPSLAISQTVDLESATGTTHSTQH